MQSQTVYKECFRMIETINGNTYFLFTVQTKTKSYTIDELDVTLIDGLDHWNCKIENEMLKSLASQSGLCLLDYAEVLLSALCDGITAEGNDDVKTAFLYDVAFGSQYCQLSWKQKLSNCTFYHLGTATLTKIGTAEVVNSLQRLYNFSFREITNLKEALHSLETECERLKQERSQAFALTFNSQRIRKATVQVQVRKARLMSQRKLNLLVRNVCGSAFRFCISSSSTVLDLKCMIHKRIGLDPELQNLSIGETILSDDSLLEDCGIANNDTLLLTIKIETSTRSVETRRITKSDEQLFKCFQNGIQKFHSVINDINSMINEDDLQNMQFLNEKKRMQKLCAKASLDNEKLHNDMTRQLDEVKTRRTMNELKKKFQRIKDARAEQISDEAHPISELKATGCKKTLFESSIDALLCNPQNVILVGTKRRLKAASECYLIKKNEKQDGVFYSKRKRFISGTKQLKNIDKVDLDASQLNQAVSCKNEFAGALRRKGVNVKLKSGKVSMKVRRLCRSKSETIVVEKATKPVSMFSNIDSRLHAMTLSGAKTYALNMKMILDLNMHWVNFSTSKSVINVTDALIANSDETFRKLELIPKLPVKKAQSIRYGRFANEIMPPREQRQPIDQDWPSVWPVAQSFKASSVPLPLRMGFQKSRSKKPPPDKHANLELMKIPNFLHLTPPAIARHCEAIRKWCTPWPEQLNSDDRCRHYFPVQFEYHDYIHAGPTIRDSRSRVVSLRVHVRDLPLDYHAKDKLLRLVGDRYDKKDDILTITTNRCPARHQNRDYSVYLLTVLFHESWKFEEWEKEKTELDMEKYFWENSKSEFQVKNLLKRLKKAELSSKTRNGSGHYSRFAYLSQITEEDIENKLYNILEFCEYVKAWDQYRNEEIESLENAKNFGKAVRNLLDLPPSNK
ncbi:28S ribosomal protein S35, mitochondrial [Trichinella zimbabwensis]|uniref:28S ribosomal protein S35, mitochondrial n=1 Tax=Trichinella zimbabwensis TaxID=268475 RepID=A0A0V1HH04_9BILA|nr:28S ribosomal protein S35, mitochondrial [Trichinella zimbabwensis]